MSQLNLNIGSDVVFRIPPDEMLPIADWNPPRIEELPSSWADAKRICLDVETKDPDINELGPGVRRKGNYVVGVSFAIEDGPEHYLSINHHGGDNCDFDVWQYLRDRLKEYKGILVFNGGGYDLDWLEENGCRTLGHRIMDIQVLDPLLNELYDRYNLDALCSRYGLPGKDEYVLRHAADAYKFDAKKDLWKLPARYVGRYGEADARRPLQVLQRQEKLIEKEGIQQIWDLEQQVTPILIKMRRRGIRINIDHLSFLEKMSTKAEADFLDQVHNMTGVRIKVGDVWKSEILAHALQVAGHNIPMTPKTKKASVDKFFLAKCGKLGKRLLRAREWNKLRTTFCAQVRRALVGDRVHVTFNQLKSTSEDGEGKGVRYGRLSSSDFNVQQQPIRNEEFGELWRQVFIADEGCEWVCSDWSQQEPRIAVHYAEKLGLPGAREFADEYRKNPSLDIHQKLADLSGMQRVIVKNYVNGRLYGMGDTKLCRSVGKPTVKKKVGDLVIDVPGPEGQGIIDQFTVYAPWVKGLTTSAARAAERNGHVWTVLRRKCRFIRRPDGRIDFAHKSFNRVGQGSAADQAKATLVEADKAGIPIQMSVHDEFDFSCSDRKQAYLIKELMENTVKFAVPMKVDLEVGPNWGALKKI